MPTASPGPIKPIERVMCFIDGGYFRKLFRDSFGNDNIKWGGLPDLLFWVYGTYEQNPFQPDLIRIYYYDAIVNSDDKEYKSQKKYFGKISLEMKQTVRLGEAIRGKDGLRQKGVDILMAIDSLTKAYQNQYDVAMFIVGDRDFIPLVKEVKNAGKKTWGIYSASHFVHELAVEFDIRTSLTKNRMKKHIL